jgi:hypothetical protein
MRAALFLLCNGLGEEVSLENELSLKKNMAIVGATRLAEAKRLGYHERVAPTNVCSAVSAD